MGEEESTARRRLIEDFEFAFYLALSEVVPDGSLDADPVEAIWTVVDSDYWRDHYCYEGLPHIHAGLDWDDPMLADGKDGITGRSGVRQYGTEERFGIIYLGHWAKPLAGLHEAAHLLDDPVPLGGSQDDGHGPRWFGHFAALAFIWAESVYTGYVGEGDG